MMSRRQRQSSTSNAFSAMMGLLPPQPPKFPKFAELVDPKTFEVAEVSGEPVRKETGLFYGLLGDDVRALHQDATENPDKYDDHTVGLLTQLVQGAKDVRALSRQERDLLDRATLSFASYVSPPKAPKVQRPVVEKTAAEEPMDALPTPGIDVPETNAPAYWWLR